MGCLELFKILVTMAKEIKAYLLERIDFNEDKIRECLKDFEKLRTEVKDTAFSIEDFPDVMKLLSDEKYRMETAIKLTSNKKAAFELLRMNERTFYRKLIVYNINQK